MLHILYLVHDLYDAAVRRRVRMLVAGGARVTVAGFQRSAQPLTEIAGMPAIGLGMTRDGRFGHRMAKIALAAGMLPRRLSAIGAVDVIMGRNLEMLALAHRVPFSGKRPRIVYECLDIHRLLLRKDAVGAAMRGIERRFLREASLVVTSSPAFTREYFRPIQDIRLPIHLLENKISEIDAEALGAVQAAMRRPAEGRPWRIGWFGMIRCRKTLALLSAFSRAMAGRFEIVVRGRPTSREFDDFEASIAAEPYMRFEGPYNSPEDLQRIYAEVDFTWAIDFFEEGLNSRWLLPTRLYEGCRYGAIPIAMVGTETERFLRAAGIGLVLPESTPEALEALMRGIDRERAGDLAGAVERCDPRLFVGGREDCRSLVRAMGATTSFEKAA